MCVRGLAGLAAAATLLAQKIAVLANPPYHPELRLGVRRTTGRGVRVPEPIIGIAWFAVTLTVGIAILAGAQFRRWFWLGFVAGVTFGAVFVHWLIYQSLYRIGALCPYCMVVWAVTAPIFWYAALHSTKAGNVRIPQWLRPEVRALAKYHAVAATAWFLGVVAPITTAFWSYWRTLIA
ncbi:MAG: vitamin K epoxide reductase family protein [Angustibacter sp.]